MKTFKYRFAFYAHLQSKLADIQKDAADYGKLLGLDKLRDKIGLYPGASACPGNLPNFVLDPIIASNRGDKIQPMQEIQEEFRYLIKDIYGEEYDGVVLNTCETALRAVHEILFAPPVLRKGDNYKARFITPLNEDFEYLSTYGCPFPPRYKALSSDRSISAGEFGVEAKSLTNLEAVLVRFEGAKYEIHGIKPNIVPMLDQIDISRSAERIGKVAERHAAYLSGFCSIGYDTPGYGHGEHNETGGPKLLELTSKIAHEYDVPHFVDCGGGLPVIGYGPSDVDADLMSWSMDKAGRAPISGLLIGKEEVMLPIRKALGIAGFRYGGQTSHGKAVYAFADPGRDAMIGLMAYLRVLKETPQLVTDPIDEFHEIIVNAFEEFEFRNFLPALRITKSYSWGGTEINYENTWNDLPLGTFGIPISTLEDFFSNTNPIFLANIAMGVAPATVYSGNIFVTPGLGTIDAEGQLIRDRAEIAAKALVKSISIVCKHAGVGA